MNTPASPTHPPSLGPGPGPGHVLVIGYGNTLRGDDGLGPRVAESIDALRLPGVRTLVCHQLAPEHADPVSQAETVVFVDAAVDAPEGILLRPLTPGPTTQLMAHAADPRTILALARDVFGNAPKAWWLTIPARRMEFGEELSPEAARGREEAIHAVRSMVDPLPEPIPPSGAAD